jgi:flagellar basal-body rod protein FlgB
MSGSINMLTVDIGNKSLDALWKRANVISDNISNSDTPGYQVKTVSFENQLKSALADNSISANELSSINPTVNVSDAVLSSDGNGVDIEQQMVELTRNQLQYSYLERALTDNLGLLRSAASEGRK